MICFDRSFLSYVERVLLSRAVTPGYAAKVRYCCHRFVAWLTYDPGIAGLDDETVNEFLAYLESRGLRPDSVSGYRRAILLVWNEAYRAGDVKTPPLRVRRIRTPREPVEAFTHEEIAALLKAAVSLTGYFPNGVARSAFWTVAIHAAYATGLRRGDLLRLKMTQIATSGVARVLQNKTGYPVTVRLSVPALAARRAITIADERLLPWPFHPNALGRQFLALVRTAGVRPGQFRWLRRSAGSYAERDEIGGGARVLGQRTPRVFRDFYDDVTISQERMVEPPPLTPLGWWARLLARFGL